MDDYTVYIVFEDDKGTRWKIPADDFEAFNEMMETENVHLVFD